MVTMKLLQLPYILVAVLVLAQVSDQASFLNPNPLPTVAKSIRGFEFNKYFDFIRKPYTRTPVDGAGKKTVVLEGEKFKWVFDLEVNTDLFSPTYRYYDANYQPQASNLRDCYYHGKVRNNPNSFLALSDCEGLHGMVVLSDHDKYSIHTLLNYNVIIMRENRPFDGIHNHEFITSPPVQKVVPPQKQEELTNRDVKFSPIDLGNGNIRSKREVFTRDTAPLKTSKPEKIVNQAPPPVFNVQNPGTKKNDKNVHLPPEIRTTTTPVVPPRVVNVKTPNPTKNDMKAPPLPPEDTPVTIVSSPPVDDKKPRYHTFGPPLLYNQRRNIQRIGVQPGATNSKKKEQIKPEANGVSHDKLEYEELLKKRKKAVKDSWRSGRNIDFEKLGLGLPEKFSAASKARKPNTTRNLIKRQVGNKKFYDIAFTLGRIEEIKSPRHAEQYLADVVNMLQWYYKKFNFNGYSVRLLSAYYLQQHKTLIDFQGLPKNVPIKYYFDTWNTLVNTNFPFQIYSPSFLLARKSKGSVITQYGRGMRSKKVCSRNSMRGVAFIKDEYVTDPYEMVNTLNHEIAYMTGIGHEGVDGCALEGKAMHPSRVAFIPWKAFSQCTLGKILCKP